MTPTRILQVCTAMDRAGLETMLMNYYRNVDRSKVQFDFLLHRSHKSDYEEEISKLGGKIHRMPAILPKNYFKYKRALDSFFKEHPEYKIVHSHINSLSFIILSVAKKNGVPVRIAHSHIAIEPYVFKNFFKANSDKVATIKETIHSSLTYFVPNYANHYFACGKMAGIWLFGKKNESKVRVIPNAIDASEFSYNAEEARNIKQELGIAGKMAVGHIGRFNEQKNHLFMLKVFQGMCHKNKNLVLLLVGEGELRTRVEEEVERLEIQEQVKFLGVRKDIPRLLQAFDLFLFPSLYEGLPVTMVEAQAAGLKIIASENVTNEVNVTKLVRNVSLKTSPEEWSEIALQELDYNREVTTDQIIKAGYDIKNNAQELQDFYLKEKVNVRN